VIWHAATSESAALHLFYRIVGFQDAIAPSRGWRSTAYNPLYAKES